MTPAEVDALRGQLAEVAEGKRFLLQGGDCAERFVDSAAEPIEAKLKILLQMSLVLTWGARIPTLRIARMAGQFSKPRSKDTETLPDGTEICAFRGDNVNSFDTSSRTPDPARLVQGYFYSAATLNYARALLSTGFADMHAARHWDLGFVQVGSTRARGVWGVVAVLAAGAAVARTEVARSTHTPPHARWPSVPPPPSPACRTRRTAGSTRAWWTASSRRSTLCACAAWETRPRCAPSTCEQR